MNVGQKVVCVNTSANSNKNLLGIPAGAVLRLGEIYTITQVCACSCGNGKVAVGIKSPARSTLCAFCGKKVQNDEWLFLPSRFAPIEEISDTSLENFMLDNGIPAEKPVQYSGVPFAEVRKMWVEGL